MTEIDPTVERVARALSESSEYHSIDGAFLLGFVTIAEWQDVDGKRWLTMLDGDSEALFCWPTDEGDDDDGD